MNIDLNNPSSSIAVITGASSGIGIEFARELISRGYDLLLTGRDQDRLKKVKEKLVAEYSQQVDLLAVDLTTPSGPATLLERAKSLGQVKVLINNAGIGSVGDFLEQKDDILDEMIQTNVVAVTRLCHFFGNEIASNGGGHILNHASYSAIQAPSNYAVYAATKSFVLSLSQSLRLDLAKRNLVITALCSGYFDSGFMKKMGQPPGMVINWLTMDRKRVAKAGIKGLFKGKSKVLPGLRYKCLQLLACFLPKSVMIKFADICLTYRQKN